MRANWRIDAEDLVSFCDNVESLYSEGRLLGRRSGSGVEWSTLAAMVIVAYKARSPGHTITCSTDELGEALRAHYGSES